MKMVELQKKQRNRDEKDKMYEFEIWISAVKWNRKKALEARDGREVLEAWEGEVIAELEE